MPQWIMDELSNAPMPDRRLGARLERLVSSLSEHPGASVPEACGPAGSKAAYRLWDNARVLPQHIIGAQSYGTCQRIQRLLEQRRQQQANGDAAAGVLEIQVIQDTTTLDYSGLRQTTGLGPLECSACQGLCTHSAMAVAEGVPLGLIHQEQWVRPPRPRRRRCQRLSKKQREARRRARERGQQRRRQQPIESKESARWLRTVRATRAALASLITPAEAGTPMPLRVVHVADREADIFALFAQPRLEYEHLLIRGAHNRAVLGEQPSLWLAVRAMPVAGEMTVQVSRSGGRPRREARLTLRYGPVTLQAPRNERADPSRPPTVTLWAVLAEELNPPPGQKAICWLLLTTLEVTNCTEAMACVRRYAGRWLIERYHFVLKSGCGIERLQLEKAERLARAAATYSIVAWRVMWLTYEARKTPEASAARVLSRPEWQALYATTFHTTAVPAEPPTLGQALRWIAQLGGFLNRRGDGEPGLKTVWRGMRRLSDIAATWELTHQPEAKRCG